ncbi:glycosyltransferase [Flavobacterium sp. DG2-3]|uniref:glycosyltransferase n=1 Tax=Flavobacterium sp. DG2-3 TaxID=3068317 RepID=UPI00273F5E74|nr:glycosyltransferase [Flavobacterium sp. DG2-3]MDP5200666.1 glycosyltransferase [Flavobacterium sp. DG2-3]
MKFAIITHVNHIQHEIEYFGYAPYIHEMNIWLKYVDEVIIVAPLKIGRPTQIDISYQHKNIDFRKVPDFSFTNVKNIFSSIFKLPIIIWNIFSVIKAADHIHLRCPGNMGLIGCVIQIFFPKKRKTAKYAGNWDPKSKQPWTYKLQKYILNNTFLTKNIEVLAYGEWNGQSKNIKSFFTATYPESEKENIEKRRFEDGVKFIFVGSLVTGKNPMYAIQLVEQLIKKGYNITLDLYGEGEQRFSLQTYFEKNNLKKQIILKGNQNKGILKEAFKQSHFVILPSKSEGWPKAIAEGMFWGALPIATAVSCVPFMLDYGKRGTLLHMDLEKDLEQLISIIKNEDDFRSKSQLAQKWSQNFTTELFETEIKTLL